MKKYRAGNLNAEEMLLFEKYLEDGTIQLEDLEDLDSLYHKMDSLNVPEPSSELKSNFYSYLNKSLEKKKKSRFFNLKSWFSESSNQQPVVLAALFILVFISGITINSIISSKSEISNLNHEISELRETMMLSLIEKPQTTERLKAVHLSEQTGLENEAVILALLETLNNDQSTNVRLAALEVLSKYAEDSLVREGLIRSISFQEHPIVQMQLAELMMTFNESKAVDEFQKLLEQNNLEPEAKQKIEESVNSITQI